MSDPLTNTRPLTNTGHSDAQLLDRAYAALGKMLDQLVVLRVTTVVGTVTAGSVADPLQPTTIDVQAQGQLVGYSAINMALGGMDVVMSKDFLGDPTLVALHKEALANSQAIRKDSIDLVRAAIDSLLSHRQG